MAQYVPENPLIVQGDHTVLVEVDSPRYEAARNELTRFAELVKSPEHIHTYRITPLSIWNACAAGTTPAQIAATLGTYSKYDVPEHVLQEVRDYASRYGRLCLERRPDGLVLRAQDEPLAEEVCRHKHVAPLLSQRLSKLEFLVSPADRGRLKQALIKVGFPAEDLAGYCDGEPLPFQLRTAARSGGLFALRPYQQDAATVFHAGGSERGGSGVIVLPCGAGKTIVGMACLAAVQSSALVLTTNVTASRQWIAELLDKTTLREDQIGEYNGSSKEVRPITVATYQILTYRPRKDADFVHLGLFDEHDWGLIIYDE
ncbi:MAG: helicase-associated domain-containing protein, partial [Planctomycetota bacterium]|nr:helicase-associated domain-containing protein [Planctomycetota bacterium]